VTRPDRPHPPKSGQLPLQDILGDVQKRSWIAIGILTAVLVYVYGNSLWGVASEWEQPEYSHGYLIPAFAAVLLWMRREPFEAVVPTSHRWWGVGLILFGTLVRVYAEQNVRFTVGYVSLIPCLMGIFVLVGGLRVLRWAAAPIAFLVFMFPLPGFLKDNILRPLQTLATRCSVYAMQTLGIDVFRDGNVIHLEQMDMNVVDACSGLRMLTIFLALSVAIAMIVTTRPWWERLIIVVSAVPVALLVNVIRITITGMLYNLNVNEEIAKHFFHDFAGWIMMPMALGFLYLELQILSHLVIETEPPQVGPRPGSFALKGPTRSQVGATSPRRG
jgi:exosortase